MNWIQSLTKAIRYIENNLTEDIKMDEVSREAFTSSSHFQLIFHVVTGLTIGEYIRNRRLSQAALDLVGTDNRIIDVAMRYQYDTQESFSKAFRRFHGVSPSKAKRKNIKLFYPLTINVTVQGGFEMSFKLVDEFYWNNIEEGEKLSDAKKYNLVVKWALKARRVNPAVFDALTEWILDDSKWQDENLAENEQILMHGVLGRFREQNAQLRTYLSTLVPSGVVNEVVFKALDKFDRELSGHAQDERLVDVVNSVFDDFSVMKDRSVREKIAGDKTGLAGVDTVDFFGYINCLKDYDANVQWALFMPDMVKRQQKDFKVDHFDYKRMPAMRFIGKVGEDFDDMNEREAIFNGLDMIGEHISEFAYDVLLGHHNGKGVDVGQWYGVWGRFMKPDTPVPEGYIHIDFLPEGDRKAGPPYLSEYAYASFSGDVKAMHTSKGYDVSGMYDVTRNIILGQGVLIPYPFKYWTAEVFLEGYKEPSTAYMFGVEL